MVATIPETKPKPEQESLGIGSGDDSGRGRDGGDGGPGGRSLSPETYRFGLGVGLASISMLFIAFTSAYIVRQGLGGDWRAIQMPPILWFTTAVLLGSSLTLELARSYLKRGLDRALRRWLTITLVLGVVFLAGQLWAWRQLAAQGIYLGTNPHSSFFYLLSGAHGLHLLGGVIALTILDFRFWILDWTESNPRIFASIRARSGAKIELAVDLTALYWHFMDGLWIYLLILLFLWR